MLKGRPLTSDSPAVSLALPVTGPGGLAEHENQVEQESLARRLGLVFEPSVALLGAMLLTFAVTVPLLPLTRELHVRLTTAGEELPLDHPALVARVDAEALAERVEVILQGGGNYLVLRGVKDPETAEIRVTGLIEAAGYRAGETRVVDMPDVDRLLDTSPGRLTAMLGAQSAVLLLAGLVLIRFRVRPEPDQTRAGPGMALALGVAAGLAALVASSVISYVLTRLGMPVTEQPWIDRLLDQRRTLGVVVPWMIVLGPVAEEVFFRAYAQRFLRQQLGFPAALMASSILFAAIHLNVSGFFVYLAISCCLGWVYERTQRVTAPIVGHVTLNSLVLAAHVFLGT